MNQTTAKGLRTVFISTFIICFIITAIIFLVMKDPVNDLSTFAHFLPFAVICTSFICSIIQLIMAGKKAKKNPEMVEYVNPKEQLSFLFIPKNVVAFIIIEIVLCFIFFAFIPSGIWYLIAPQAELSHVAHGLLKAIVISFCAGFATMYASVFFTGLFADKRHNAVIAEN